jgi:glutamate-1-semialdehyde 2,1-aminomutase
MRRSRGRPTRFARPAGRSGDVTTKVVQFNDLDALEAALATATSPACWHGAGAHQHRHRAARSRLPRGRPRALRPYGTLLIIDETHTICAGPGGATRAWGLDPDFFVIGKTIGGGMPVAAYGMTEEVAARLSQPVKEDSIDTSGVGGTLTGNALALAAVRATLSSRCATTTSST